MQRRGIAYRQIRRPLLLIALLAPTLFVAPKSTKAESRERPFRATGERLETVLARASRSSDENLTVATGLSRQRVSLYVSEAPGERFRSQIARLLSATSEANVTWRRLESGEWVLEESQARRNLARKLRDIDLAVYRRHVSGEMAWLANDAEKALAEPPSVASYRARLMRYCELSLFAHLGEEGFERLMASGQPAVVSIKDLPNDLRKRFREALRFTFGSCARRSDEELDSYALVLLIARHGWDVRGTMTYVTYCTPEGAGFARMSMPSIPHPIRKPWDGEFSLPPADPNDMSERVSLNLSPTSEQERAAASVERNLDQLLATLHSQLDIDVVADGYLRAPKRIPANLKVKDYPLAQLMRRLALVWPIRWEFVQAERKTLYVRATEWWLEDAADVPHEIEQRLRRTLADPEKSELQELLLLADLSMAQVQKLIQCKACPAALGLVGLGRFDNVGPKPCLQFYNRLPPDLKKRVVSRQGLRLGDADSALVDQWLTPTVLAVVGTVNPDHRKELVLSFEGADNGSGSLTIRIRSARPGGPNWYQGIGAAARMGR